MLEIAGGIILGFVAIVVILALAEPLVKLLGSAVLLVLFLAVLATVFYVISIVPYAKEILVFTFLTVVAGLSLAGLIYALFEHVGTKSAVVVLAGIPIVSALLSYLIFEVDPTMDGWLGIMFMFTGVLAFIVWWCLTAIALVRKHTRRLEK